MRIVQILPALDDGGVERGTVDSSVRYVQAGHESWVISAGGKRVQDILRGGGKHVQLPVKSKNPLSVPWRVHLLRQALRRIRPDIIHYRSRVPGWLTRWANASADLRIPTVSTLHGLNHPGWYSRIMVRADRVVCVSTAGRAFVRQHYPEVPESRLVVIPRGVDLERFDPAHLDAEWTANFRERFGLEGKFVATAVGRISALKGLDVLLRAVAEARKEIPEIVALIVGDPQEGQERVFADLQQLVGELGIEANVRFAGSQRQIPEIDALADVVCSCNVKKPESFGRTVAEALAMDTPVIAAAHGGVLDIVREGVDGFLVPPGDSHALAQALIQIRRTPLRNLRQHIAENFTADRMVADTLALYNSLLQR